MKLEDNTLYYNEVTGLYFWYCNGEFITLNEYTGNIECYEEEELLPSFNFMQKVEEELELDNLIEEDESNNNESQYQE